MPELSRFQGIIIRMYAERTPRIIPLIFMPTIKMRWEFTPLTPIDLLSGGLPKRQQRLVEAWAELYQAELLTDWELLQQGRRPNPIPPLK